MIASHAFAGKKVAVFGLARTGLSAVRALAAGGSDVIAWDDNATARDLGGQAGAEIQPWREWGWSGIAALVLSPGVPLTHPRPHEVVLHATRAGVSVIGDVELFAREIRPDGAVSGRAPVIAITGTNGKSTTTALVGHILAANGFDAQVGGNIGKAVLELGMPTARTIYVIEMSTFQIDLAPGLRPDVALLSNLSPDHIDRHGSMENYAAIKARLLRQVPEGGLVAIGVDDDFSSAIFTALAGTGATPVSVGKVLGRGIFVVDGVMYDAQGQTAAKVMALDGAKNLPGAHNWQNAALAYAATKPFVKDPRAIAAAIESFPGLAHRMEDVGAIGRTRFINDSKATNADAAAKALAVYPDIFWIAGGKAKDGGIESLAPFFDRVRRAYLIGEAAPAFARTLDGKAPYVMANTLERAVELASADAAASSVPAPVVLLSPACASYDQFKDFEQRGDVFRNAVARFAAVAGGVMMNRADRSGFAAWWFTVDRMALVLVLALIAIGLMLAFAASPAITGGPLTAGDFRYAARQITFAAVAAGIMGGVSLLSLRQVKILAAVTFAGALVGTFLVLFVGADVLGARRELDFGVLSLQPSEFLKPSFAILAAAVLSDREALPLPKPLITFLMLAPALAILLLQPDVGQTGLLLSLWGAMLFFWGLPLFWVALMAGVTAVMGVGAYTIFPHVHHRVDQYLSSTDTGYQAGLALKAFAHGGFAGVGPGAGTIKYRIPDAHSDFIFAVAGEEFGFILCGLIALIFCCLTVRLLLRAANAREGFCQLAGAGLALVTAVQAFINMGVAVSLLPAKGMTLPFISYGGSSLFAVALTMGLALAVTRQRPKVAIRADGVLQWSRA